MVFTRSILRYKYSGTAQKNTKSVIQLAEETRKETLASIYVPAFKSLSKEERVQLAFSGDIWWKYSGLGKNEVNLLPETLKLLSGATLSASKIVFHDSLKDKNSPIWKAFRVALSHHSTSIEGNTLTMEETAKVIDEFAEGIAIGIGISEPSSLKSSLLHGLPTLDVVEVVNHAAAMEFIRENWFGNDEITIHHIQKLFDVLMPHSGDVDNLLSMSTPFPPNHGNFRTMPITVRGSSAVRPYPHEIVANMTRILDLYNVHRQRFHPIVSSTLFMMNFLFVHPFYDGNGRMSRLLFQTLLFNSGYFGCLFLKGERSIKFSHFDPYFTSGNANSMVYYAADRVIRFHEDIRNYENKKGINFT